MRTTVPRPAPARPRLATRALAGLLAAATAATLSGCGLRWETDAPSEPVPDAAEAARRTAVDDALDLAAAARAAAAGADAATAEVLALVDGAATAQADALGGVYDSGLPAATPTPTTTATPVTADPASVLARLGTGTSQARADAIGAVDPGLARLLASVAASRAQLAARLAGALGTEPPVVDTALAATDWTPGGSADGSGSGDGSADGSAAQSPSPSPDASATAAPTAPADAQGDDLDRTTVLALVLAEDQAGFGLEVAAARLDDAERERARSQAAAHRAAATAWALAGEVAGTADDPRRVSYALGADVSTPDAVRTFCAGLLTDLAAAYADAVLATSAGTTDRAATVDGLRENAVASLAWQGTPTPLPGLPATA